MTSLIASGIGFLGADGSCSTATSWDLSFRLRTWLKCPYAQKDMAKAMGAKFDFNGCKKWYVPAGVDPTLFARWL